MKKNKIFIIGCIVFLVILVIVFVLFKDSLFPKFVFELNGDNYITHNLNEEFHDLGVNIKEGTKDLSDEVIVDNSVDVNTEGVYIITYSYKDKVLKRYVEVKKLNFFKLNGDSDIYLLLNGQYLDPKVEATFNGVDCSNEVIINSDLDSSKKGDYKISYTLNQINKTLERIIHVSDFSEFFKINYDDKNTLLSINLEINIDKEKVSKYTLPDGSIKDDNSNFTIDKNGEYVFVIYDKYNNKYAKKIVVSNIKIIEPINASCTGTIKDGKTTIEVVSNKEISKYVYNGVESKNKTYTFNKEISDNKVLLYDNDNQKQEITCTTKVVESEKLEIHFMATGFYDDGILIRSPKATIFMDGGRGRDRVLQYLKDLNISKIDYVIGSHTEYDHIYAQGAVIRTFKVGAALYPNNIKKCGCSCDNNDVWEVISASSATGTPIQVQPVPSVLNIGDMTLYFIAPTQIVCNKNNNSFVFILVYKNNTFMFTGDADSVLHNVDNLNNTAKKLGLATGIDVDVLKYPHHGNQILDNKFVNALSPKAIIIPNYNAPQYGSVAYRNQGIGVYRQSDSKTGNILITSDGSKLEFIMDIEAKNYAK